MLSRSTQSRTVLRNVARRAFSTQEAAGVKVVARDGSRPVSEVSVVIKAGSRYNTTPGISHVLKNFAFRNTSNRSALRLTRESELLGGQLSASLSRENIVLSAKFLRKDLPYFVEALSDTLSNTLFAKYELVEDVLPITFRESQKAYQNAAYVSAEAAYQAAFRTGLGNPLLAEAYSPVNIDQVKNYANSAFNKANITVVGSSVIEKDLAILVGEHFAGLSTGTPLIAPETKAYAGDIRIKRAGPSALTIAFPTTTASPALAILAQVLGGHSAIKNTPGSTLLSHVAIKTGTTISTNFTSYGDASVLAVTISGASAPAIAQAARSTASQIREFASDLDVEHIEKAANRALFSTAELSDTSAVGAFTKVTESGAISIDAIMDAANKVSGGTVAVGAVGQVHQLPYASDLF